MCLSQKAPAPAPIPEPTPPIDREAEAAQKAYGKARDRRNEAFDESDTDVVGSLVAQRKKTQVNTQLKTLMGG